MTKETDVRLLYRYICRHSVHSTFSSCPISTDTCTCTLLHRTIILPFVCVWLSNLVPVLKGTVLAKVKCEPKMEEVTGDWRKVHSEKLHDLHSSNTMRLIKLRRMKWAGHVACVGRQEIQSFLGV